MQPKLVPSLFVALLTLAALGPFVPVSRAVAGDLVATVHFSHDCSLGVGLTFDGTDLWYSCVGASPDLYRADPITGTVLDSYTVAGGLGSLAYDATRNIIWAGPGSGSFANAVVTIPLDASHHVSGSFSPAFNVPEAAAGGCSLDDGLAIDGTSDELLVSFDCSMNVYRYAASTGAFLGSLPFNGASCYNSGVAIGGDLLYEGNDGCSHVYVVDKSTNAASYDFPTAVSGDPNFRDEGLTCDPLTFASQGKEVMWSKEAFSPMRAAAYEIAPGTCGVGGQRACVVDPTLTASIARPALGSLYVNDVQHPGDPGLAVVLGDVTVQAAASDPTRIASATWSVDGVPIASGLTSAPWTATWLASAASPGAHTLRATLRTADGSCPAIATELVRVAKLTMESASRALFATTLQPAEPTVQSEGASVPGSGESWLRDQAVPQLGLRAQVLHDTATEASARDANASSEVANVSLLGGLVTATLLHAEARASADLATVTLAGDDQGSSIVGLVVDGNPVTVSQPNTQVTIPGVGTLVLDERQLDVGHTHVEVRVNALHFYPAHDGLRGEIVLGQAVAGADIASVPFQGRGHDVDPQDDAGTGGDVGNTYATGYLLPLSGPASTVTVGGRVGGADAADVYLVQGAPGVKLDVVAEPSTHATATTHTVPTPPAVGGATLDGVVVPNLQLQLVDPISRAPLLTSALPLGAPQRLDLDLNESGVWAIEVTSSLVANYTLSVTVTPTATVPESPTGASCGDPAAPALTQPVANAITGDEVLQDYRLDATIGDDVVVTLAMPDPDGQDLDLTLYDASCHELARSALGKPLLYPGDSPKGVPEAVARLPALYTGAYYVEVSRFVGQGSYVLSAVVQSPIPTLPTNDALTGADASNDCSAPTPLPAPDGVFEGRFEDGDPRDCYSFTLAAGDATTIAFLPSPANTGVMHVTGGGAVVENEDALGSGTVFVANRATTAQTVVVELDPTTGGGNYLLAVAHQGGGA